MQWADTIDFGRCDSEENGNHMKIDATEFRLREGDEVDLGLWATKVKPLWNRKRRIAKCCRTKSSS